jgi:hypothetical protein
MAMLWEYPAQWQRAGAVSSLVVPARTRRAAALAVGLLERSLATRGSAAGFVHRPTFVVVLRAEKSALSAQLIEQRLRLFQIARVKPFGEPAIDRIERASSRLP